MSNGNVGDRNHGAVIDVEFEKIIFNVYEALTIDGLEIILEVQQQFAMVLLEPLQWEPLKD